MKFNFPSSAFNVIIAMNSLSHFDDKINVISKLSEFVKKDGRIFFSTLVKNNRLSDCYLDLLYKFGIIGIPHNFSDFKDLLTSRFKGRINISVVGNMAYGILIV